MDGERGGARESEPALLPVMERARRLGSGARPPPHAQRRAGTRCSPRRPCPPARPAGAALLSVPPSSLSPLPSPHLHRPHHAVEGAHQLARHPLELALRQGPRVDRDAPFGPAEGHVQDGALPGHERRQAPDLVHGRARVQAPAALVGPPRVVVLDPVGVEGGDLACGGRGRRWGGDGLRGGEGGGKGVGWNGRNGMGVSLLKPSLSPSPSHHCPG